MHTPLTTKNGQSCKVVSASDSARPSHSRLPFYSLPSGKKYDVIIVGAGPAGLACAKLCAEGGAKVAVLEKKSTIGKKICAGGITMHGLLGGCRDILQRSFTSQTIVTRRQKAEIKTGTALIATISRQELGREMAGAAEAAGADIFTDCQVKKIKNGTVALTSFISCSKENCIQKELSFSFLVGADGANSLVRRYLGIISCDFGLGLNYQLKSVCREKMEWHLEPKRFGSGYAWIFPHKTSCSVGAYCDYKTFPAAALKKNLNLWAQEQGFALAENKLEAAMVNFDYRGLEFAPDNSGINLGGNRIFLAGDAAGLASGLTGEGIYSAVLSGKYVGNRILRLMQARGAGDERCSGDEGASDSFARLLRNHQRHSKAVLLARHIPPFALPVILDIASEATCLALRTGLLSVDAAELGS